MSDNESIPPLTPIAAPAYVPVAQPRFQMPAINLSGGHILMLILAVGITWWLTKRNLPTQAIAQTQMAEFKALSDKVDQLAGHVVTQSDLESKVKAQMGPAFVAAVSKQGGTLTNLATAVGQIQGQLSAMGHTTVQKTPIGGFSTVLSQDRGKAPALTSLSLNYDPASSGLSSQWNNHTEKFTASYGEWRTSADGARSAISLSRDVYDGSTKIGTEQIPLVNGDAYFSQSDIARTVPLPKYTFMIGSSYDLNTGKPRVSGLLGRQITDASGIATGFVNNSWAILYTYRFGAK